MAAKETEDQDEALRKQNEAFRRRERVRTDDFREIYANALQVEITRWDFKVFFGKTDVVPGESAKLRVLESMAVYMSPQHAKALAAVFASQVKSYEEHFGPIPDPPPVPTPVVTEM